MARQQKRPRDPNKKLNNKKKIPCSICGYPDEVKYEDKDEDGCTVFKTHIVECLGHGGVHPSMWNKHPDYTKFQKYSVRQRQESLRGQR